MKDYANKDYNKEQIKSEALYLIPLAILTAIGLAAILIFQL